VFKRKVEEEVNPDVTVQVSVQPKIVVKPNDTVHMDYRVSFDGTSLHNDPVKQIEVATKRFRELLYAMIEVK
jgi:hypothetical protein